MITEWTKQLISAVQNWINYSEKLFHISAAKKIIQNNFKTYSYVEECLQS
jgi:hypothetical protein